MGKVNLAQSYNRFKVRFYFDKQARNAYQRPIFHFTFENPDHGGEAQNINLDLPEKQRIFELIGDIQ